jgi:hypothetical protein
VRDRPEIVDPSDWAGRMPAPGSEESRCSNRFMRRHIPVGSGSKETTYEGRRTSCRRRHGDMTDITEQR